MLRYYGNDFEKVMVEETVKTSITLVVCALSVTVILLVSGCSLFMPGLSTRTAMQSKVDTQWNRDGDLTITENTTSKTDTLTAEGESVEISWSESGKPISVSGATHVLRQTRDPQAAGDTFAKLAVENAKVAGQIMQTINTLGSVVAKNLTRPAPAPPSTQPAEFPIRLPDPEGWRQMRAAERKMPDRWPEIQQMMIRRSDVPVLRSAVKEQEE